MDERTNARFAIIVVAYNRPYETRRLIDSICYARYGDDNVDLIIDIDKGIKQEEIVEAIKNVNWNYGKFQIISRPERMGLRPHILECGKFTHQYDAIILLEDDLIVSPAFYEFAKAATEKYDSDNRIAQISLYTYSVNEFEARPFIPARSNSDVFAMQIVQSWGECWTKRMWEDFEKSDYYTATELPANPNLHKRVNSWGKNSWKKVFSNYISAHDLFVIYPYNSFTTNYSEAGEHCKRIVSDYQVCLEHEKRMYTLPELDACIRYDGFFERIFNPGEVTIDSLCIDIYGSKNGYEHKRYLASTKRLPYLVIKEYGLIRKPCEDNVRYKEPGKGIFIYDLTQKTDKLPEKNEEILINYDYGYFSWRRSFKHGLLGLRNSLREKMRR